MRNLLLSTSLLMLFCAVSASNAQTVPSNCNAPESVKKTFLNDARGIALNRIFYFNSSYKDSIDIPKIWSDSVMNALIAIYNAPLPEADTVRRLHLHSSSFYRTMLLQIDTSQAWLKQLESNVPVTLNPLVDSLVKKYGLKCWNHYYSMWGCDEVELATDSIFNLSALSNLFASISNTYPIALGFASNDPSMITLDTPATPAVIQLTYRIGWGDCAMGCICERKWKFSVDTIYNVTHTNTIGYPGCGFPAGWLYVSPLASAISDRLFVIPNPAFNQIRIAGYDADFYGKLNGLRIINSAGQLSMTLNNPNIHSIDISSLNSGFYTLYLIGSNNNTSIHFLKR